MDGEFSAADFHRLLSLAEKFHDERYRDRYVAAHTRGVLARQMRNFRGDLSQDKYASKIGNQKTVIARLENPAYGGWSLRTMFEIAQKENVAVLVRFVDFPTFLSFTNDQSDDAFHPVAYNEVEIDRFAAYQSGQTSYYDIRLPVDIYAGSQMRGGTYSEVFFGAGASLNLPSVNAGNLAVTGVGSGSVGVSGYVPNFGALVGVTGMGIVGYPVTAPASPRVTAPATPYSLNKAHEEIRKLDEIVNKQAQENEVLKRENDELKKLLSETVLPNAILNPQGQGGQVVPFRQRVA